MRTRSIALILASLVFAADAWAQVPPPPATPAPAPIPAPAPPAPPAPPRSPRHSGRYQGGPEQTERFTRKVKLGKNGWVNVSNIAGDIVVSAAPGDEVTIDAVKHARGNQSELANVRIDVDARPGRVEISSTPGDNERSWVDFTITLPADAGVEVHSVSGDITVNGVSGAVRAETVSGAVVASKTPRLERARSVSGEVTLSDVASDGDLSAGSISGSVRATGLKARGLDLSTVSGDVNLKNVTCDRVGAKSISGAIEYSGNLTRNGRYDLTTHSGAIRLTLAGTTGFELNANSFSGSIRSDLPLKIGGEEQTTPPAGDDRDRRHGRGMFERKALRGTFGDGAALITVRTFSGSIVIAKAQ